jgi:hypothetical protein
LEKKLVTCWPGVLFLGTGLGNPKDQKMLRPGPVKSLFVKHCKHFGLTSSTNYRAHFRLTATLVIYISGNNDEGPEKSYLHLKKKLKR